MKLLIDFDPKDYGLIPADKLKEVLDLLNKLYGTIWTEAYYDPANEHTQKWAKVLDEDFSRLNKLLGFKK